MKPTRLLVPILMAVMGWDLAANATDGFRYCGELLWPAHRVNYLPFPEGMAVDSSSDPHAIRQIGKVGKFEVRLSFEDAYSSNRFLQQAIELLISQGENRICVLADTIEASAAGLPVEISPYAENNGKLLSGYGLKK
ncbi:hypothetical protein E4Q23_19505 [Candidatus Accumulibacter phosphatis]|jgi:hypothetical protein|uniref:Uncharacterized protein n=1 Tax=Candidatus Accumulibacter phosphatis TaxID=327160 RepID=A0ABX1TZY8_9PROT|nr:hypothetical protein [Candidatus Accumulibacter phosphatis]NMQ29760.1 hypothetical protein [Candidatus Accumulibacter phosphatis]